MQGFCFSMAFLLFTVMVFVECVEFRAEGARLPPVATLAQPVKPPYEPEVDIHNGDDGERMPLQIEIIPVYVPIPPLPNRSIAIDLSRLWYVLLGVVVLLGALAVLALIRDRKPSSEVWAEISCYKCRKITSTSQEKNLHDFQAAMQSNEASFLQKEDAVCIDCGAKSNKKNGICTGCGTPI